METNRTKKNIDLNRSFHSVLSNFKIEKKKVVASNFTWAVYICVGTIERWCIGWIRREAEFCQHAARINDEQRIKRSHDEQHKTHKLFGFIAFIGFLLFLHLLIGLQMWFFRRLLLPKNTYDTLQATFISMWYYSFPNSFSVAHITCWLLSAHRWCHYYMYGMQPK